LGFNKVKDECEKIQHYGHNKDATGEIDEKDDQVCLDNIAKSIKEAKTVYNKVHERMNKFYADS
jgi:osomolarity two-component system phosphorelay intermediate protein YPD1